MVVGFRRVQQRLPFPITHFHPDTGSPDTGSPDTGSPDTGSEFFNHHLLRYFGPEISGLKLSRSRPYRKNGNRFVEQKNSTLVRAYVGYHRLETAGQWVALNALYASSNPRQLREEI